MSITDLTGTKWKLNSTLSFSSISGSFNFRLDIDGATFDGTSAIPTNYTTLYVTNSGNYPPSFRLYGYSGAGDFGFSFWDTSDTRYNKWYSTSPSGQRYTNLSSSVLDILRTFTITGGLDVTDSSLISWLEANGTLTPSSSPSTADKLQDLIDIKQDIKEAIENKGADLTGVDFGGYAGKIDTLPAVVEMTQAQYDALPVYDDNTYYLIVEA